MKLKFKTSKNGKAFFINLWRNGVHDYINPVRDWTVGLVLGTIVFLMGVSYIAFDFYTQFEAPRETIHVESQPIRYRDSEVQKYAELYVEKERIFNELRGDRTYVVEPIPEVVNTARDEEVIDLGGVELAQ